MNSYQAKRIPLTDVLGKLGHRPHHTVNGESWYLSPFREEDEPSFHLSKDAKAWFDFGEGKGGNTLEFALRYFRLPANDISGALQKLEDLGFGNWKAPQSAPLLELLSEQSGQGREGSENGHVTITKKQPVEHSKLRGYLKERAIPLEVALPYVLEIHYTREELEDKSFYTLAFANDSGGYEFRNFRFKGVQGKKDITTLHREKFVPGGAVTVFEGFFDYLSALAWYRKTEADTPVIVLNSVQMGGKVINMVKHMGAGKVHLYLDQDAAGKNLTQQFQEQLPGVEVLDHSGLYEGYEDFNAFVQAKRKDRGRSI